MSRSNYGRYEPDGSPVWEPSSAEVLFALFALAAIAVIAVYGEHILTFFAGWGW